MSSMKDVAKLAGVSLMTVSRVVNQRGSVEESTRRKVENAIGKLNYKPNLLARALNQQRWQSPDPGASLYAVYEKYREYAQTGQPYPGSPGKGRTLAFAGVAGHVFFCRAVEQGVIHQAKLAGFGERGLIIQDNKFDAETALHNAEHILSLAPGIFVEYQHDIKVNHIVAERCDLAGLPIIAVDIPMPGAPFVGVNNWLVAKAGGEYMAKLIKEKWRGWSAVDLVILLQSPEAGEYNMLRSEGVATALVEAFGDEVESKIVRTDRGIGTEEHAREAMHEILRTYPHAQKIAVTSITEETITGALHALQETNRWASENTIVITIGMDKQGVPQLREGLTDAGVAFFPEKYGEYITPAACAMLDGTPVPSHMYVEHQIVTRENINRFYPQ